MRNLEEMQNVKTITVEKAASIIHKSPEFIRAGLRQDKFNFGAAVQGKTGQWNYVILENKFLEWLGIKKESDTNEKEAKRII